MLSIGQLSKLAGVSNRTLRYYEELGLIEPNTRGENRYRYYDETHLQRLNTIRSLQEGGFALKEIVSALSPALEKGASNPLGQEMARKVFEALALQRDRLIMRQKEISQTIEELQKMMKGFNDCFGCQESSHLSECANCSKGPSEIKGLGQQWNLADAAKGQQR